MMKLGFIQFTFLLVFIAGPLARSAQACPAFINAAATTNLGVQRQQLSLYAVKIKNDRRQWVALSLQIDPLDEQGVLQASELSQAMQQPLTKSDRLVMRVEDFGSARRPSDGQPCKLKSGSSILEVRNPYRSNAYAYLVACEQPASLGQAVVKHDKKNYKIESDKFSYEYLAENQLMFKSVKVLSEGKFAETSANSNILIKLDIKKFFNLNFDNSNIRSFVKNDYTGPLGVVSSISFFLKILFFNINLRMDTSASFYEDAAMIPMKFKAPMEDVLNPGSSTVYWWLLGKGSRIDYKRSAKTLPIVRPDLIKKGRKSLADYGLAYCKSECVFRMYGFVGKEGYTIDINVPKYLVERGFFPMFVNDLDQLKEDMNWGAKSIKNPKGAVAMYLETAHIPKGLHQIHQWLRIGKQAHGACPHKVEYKIVKP